jgi:hypothetical protein
MDVLYLSLSYLIVKYLSEEKMLLRKFLKFEHLVSSGTLFRYTFPCKSEIFRVQKNCYIFLPFLIFLFRSYNILSVIHVSCY